jgi:NADH-quinone oxidoreductase subunit C
VSEPLRGEVREVEAARAHEALAALKDEGFNMLVDLTCFDRQKLGLSPRFLVIWRLMKLSADGTDAGRVELRAAVGEEPVLRSSRGLWPAADWLEREVWDMYGVRFTDRPGIKRLLMYESFVGHPLRKDYPIAKRQPLIGPASGEMEGSPSFNATKPALAGE